MAQPLWHHSADATWRLGNVGSTFQRHRTLPAPAGTARRMRAARPTPQRSAGPHGDSCARRTHQSCALRVSRSAATTLVALRMSSCAGVPWASGGSGQALWPHAAPEPEWSAAAGQCGALRLVLCKSVVVLVTVSAHSCPAQYIWGPVGSSSSAQSRCSAGMQSVFSECKPRSPAPG